jgi:hypothetical protein
VAEVRKLAGEENRSILSVLKKSKNRKMNRVVVDWSPPTCLCRAATDSLLRRSTPTPTLQDQLDQKRRGKAVKPSISKPAVVSIKIHTNPARTQGNSRHTTVKFNDNPSIDKTSIGIASLHCLAPTKTLATLPPSWPTRLV